MLRALPALVCLLAPFFMGPAICHAETEPVGSLLDAAEEAFLDVEYERALGLLLSAEEADDLTDEQMTQLLALRGTLHFLLGDTAAARLAYVRLLSLDRSYELSEIHPPRAAEFLEEIRQEASGPVSLSHSPPSSFAPGQPLELEAVVEGATSSHDVRIFYRVEGERGYSSTEMIRVDGDRHVGTVPAMGALGSDRGGEVEYFIVVADGDQRLANSGSPTRPHVLRTEGGAVPVGPAGGSPSIVRRWWFWTAIGGAVVLALGLGLGIGLGTSDDGATGSVDVTLRFPEDR